MATDVAEVIGGAIALHILFELPLLARRGHHRGGVVAAAADSGPARTADLRAGHHRPAAGDRHRVHRELLRLDAAARRNARRAGAPIPRHRKRAVGRGHPGRHGDAARGVSAFRASPGTGTAIPTRGRIGAGCCGSPGWDVVLAMVVAGTVNAAMLLIAALTCGAAASISSIEVRLCRRSRHAGPD